MRTRSIFTASLLALAACQPAPASCPAPDETEGGEAPARMGASGTAPANQVNLTYLADAVSNADVTSDIVATGSYRLICFEAVMLSTSTPVGAFSIQGSVDGTHFYNLFLGADKVYGANFTNVGAYPGGYTVGVSSPSDTVVISACIENSYPNVRALWDRSTGGTTAALDIAIFQRSN